MNQMVTDGVMTKEQRDQYLEPTKVEKTVEVEREKGFISAIMGKKTTKTIVVDGPSQFEKDMEKVFESKRRKDR